MDKIDLSGSIPTIELSKLLIAQKTVFNVEDFSLYSGLSKSAIYKLLHLKKIRYSCPSGKLKYFKKTDVDDFLLKNPVNTVNEIEEEAARFLLNNNKVGGKKW